MYIRTNIINVLSPMQRKVLGMCTMGDTLANAAKKLGISRNTANNHLHTARVKLRNSGLMDEGRDVKALIRRYQLERPLSSTRVMSIIFNQFPPSWNDAYPNRKGGKGRYPSKQTKQWKISAEATIAGYMGFNTHLNFPWEGRCGLLAVFHFPKRGGWDLDNREKLLSDSLTTAGIWVDDSHVDSLGLEINHCPECEIQSTEAIVWEMEHA